MHLRFLILTLAAFTSISALANDATKESRSKLQEWVETQRILSEEQADWMIEQEALKDTSELLSQELETLEQSIKELQATTTAADEEKAELNTQIDERKRVVATSEAMIAQLEKKIAALYETFPQPLKATLKPIYTRIPKDPANTTVQAGQRLANITYILQKAEEFNSDIHVVNETVEENGTKFQVKVVYWGLSEGWYVDAASKSTAGRMIPGPDGWTKQSDPSIAEQVATLVGVYEDTADIQFVDLPVSVQ